MILAAMLPSSAITWMQEVLNQVISELFIDPLVAKVKIEMCQDAN